MNVIIASGNASLSINPLMSELKATGLFKYV